MAETKQGGFHRAWLVFIGVCMMMAGGMGLILNVVGNYFPVMAMEFGLTTPDGGLDVAPVTLLMTVYSYVMLVCLLFVGRLFDKVDARILFGVCGLLLVVACLLFNVWSTPWQIYISGAMWGIAGPAIFLVGPSFLINNWFAPSQTGKFLGIASAFTGIGTFVWSPVFAGFIANLGYKTAWTIEACIAAVLILIPAFFFFRTRPEDVGLKPWGIEKEVENAEEAKKTGVSAKFAIGTLAFWMILIAAGLISLGGGYKSLMPTAVQSIGGPDMAMLGATMVSAGAIGNVLGKILLGFLADKLGIRTGMLILIVINAIGFACMFIFLPQCTTPEAAPTVAMLIAGFGIGIADAEMSVGLPLLTRTCFGDRCYGQIYSWMNTPIAILGGLGATFVAVVANVTGSFTNAYVCGIAFAAVILICTFVAVGSAKKFKDKWTLEGEPDATRH